jgi:TIR domain
LSPLQRLRYITGWFYRDIQAGTDWKQEIEKQLDSANIILVLVSADFIASDYCYSVEMEQALEKHQAGTAYVIPIILRPVAWEETPLGELSALPTGKKPVTQWADRDEAWFNVVQGIRDVVRTLLPKHLLSQQETSILYSPALRNELYPKQAERQIQRPAVLPSQLPWQPLSQALRPVGDISDQSEKSDTPIPLTPGIGKEDSNEGAGNSFGFGRVLSLSSQPFQPIRKSVNVPFITPAINAFSPKHNTTSVSQTSQSMDTNHTISSPTDRKSKRFFFISTRRRFLFITLITLAILLISALLFTQLMIPSTNSTIKIMHNVATRTTLPAKNAITATIAAPTTAAQVDATATAGVIQTVTAGAANYTDPLTDANNPATQKALWDADTTHCVFQQNGYHVLQKASSLNSVLKGCIETGYSYTNLAASVDVTIVSGSSGGIFFRTTNQGLDGAYAGYLFEVNSQGQYRLSRSDNFSRPDATTLQDWTVALAWKTGNNVKNTLQVWANGGTLDLYANNAFLKSVQDTTFTTGNIAFLAATTSGGEDADIFYTNLQVFSR